MGTAIVLFMLLGVVGMIIRSMVKDKKAGKSLQCGQNCKHCSGHSGGHCGHSGGYCEPHSGS